MLKELITRFLLLIKTLVLLALIVFTVCGFNSLNGSDANSNAENFIKINMQDLSNCYQYHAELYNSSNQWQENCGPSQNCICGFSGYSSGYYNVKIDNGNCYSWKTNIYHSGFGFTDVVFYHTDEFDCYK